MEENKKIRLHQPLLAGIEDIIKEVFIQGKKSDQVVPGVLKNNPKWGSRDRSFVAENAYEIVRNKRLIQYVLDINSLIEVPFSKLVGAWLIIKGNFIEGHTYFEGLDVEKIKDRAAISDPKIKFSMPDTLNDYIVKELGEEIWYKELEAMSSPADVYIRVNASKVSKEVLKKNLEAQGINLEGVPGLRYALKLTKRANLTATPEFKKGFFEIQDAGSQMISEFLNPESGEFVIDTCAGAGGKTLHIADLMKNKGRILSMDVEKYKLEELEKRVTRNKFSIVSTQLINKNAINNLKNSADKILMDVPCSGLGTIKRNPDAKEFLTPGFIEDIKNVQADILENYSSMLKSGGTMVYATCSILPSENRNQVDNFLENNKDFTLIKDKQIWPSENGFDGFYMALIQKV